MADPVEPTDEGEDVTQATEPTVTATTSHLLILNTQQRIWLYIKCYWRSFITVIAPIAFLPIITCHDETKDYRMLYTFCVMAVYWVTQAIPIPITGMLPVMFLPALGISKVNTICTQYLREACMMFMLNSFMAYCMEKSGLYKRCALKWMLLIGCTHFRLTLGVCTIAAIGGMVFTNIIATEVMLAIIISLLTSLEEAGMLRYVEEENVDNPERPIPTRTVSCYLLGITYCTSIGATATVIACGTNLATRNFVMMYYGYYIQYQMWFAACFILAVIETFVVWFWLNISMLGLFWENRSDPEIREGDNYEFEEHVRQALTNQYDEMGPIKSSEITVACLYVIVIILWLFRYPIYFDGLEYVISDIFKPLPKLIGRDYMSDVSFTILIVFLLAVLPTKLDYCFFCGSENQNRPKKGSTPILEWKPFAKKVNWFTFSTLGGGFALITGMFDSEFLLLIDLDIAKDLSSAVILLFFCFITIVLTQFISNTALFFLIVPIAARVAQLANVSEFHIVVCIGVSCSLSFMLPLSSVPNQIMYSKAKVPIKDMVIAGIIPTLSCFILTYINFLCLGPSILKKV